MERKAIANILHRQQRIGIRDAYMELRAELLTGEREYAAALLWELDRV